MIEFKGTISEETKNKEIKTQSNANKKRGLIFFIFASILFLLVVGADYLLSNEKPRFIDLITSDIPMFFLLLFIVALIYFIVVLVKPFYNKDLDKNVPFSVCLDNDKIVYAPESGFGKREFNYANLKKIYDEGSYYVIVSKENNIRLICEKDLLVQGSLKEFDEYFNKIIVRNAIDNSYIEKEAGNKKVENLEYSKEDEVKVENDGGEANLEQSAENEKTFTKDKFKKSKNRNEKSFKFALIGVTLGLIAVALTPIVVKFGINFAVNTITYIFNGLFYGGFVVELITFVLACMFVLMAAVVLFPACVLLTPAMALLSLIFPIYQLVSVNRRWFSWVSLVIGILSIGGCLLIAVTTLQGI